MKKLKLEFIVEQVAFTSVNDHGILKLKLPYFYSKMEGKVKKGDIVTVIINQKNKFCL